MNSDLISTEEIIQHLATTFHGLTSINTWGERSFFYNPEGLFKRGVYFCTIKEKNGANDKASGLERDNVFRINFGVPKQTFLNLFTVLPKRPAQGGVIDGGYDFKRLDTLTPHPIYGWAAWVSILSPSYDSWYKIQPLLLESYALVVKKYKKRKDTLYNKMKE